MSYSSICLLLIFVRNRTSTIKVMYSLYLYFLGLSLRTTSKALTIFRDEKKYPCLYGTGFKDLILALVLQKEKNFCIYH